MKIAICIVGASVVLVLAIVFIAAFMLVRSVDVTGRWEDNG